MIISVIANPHSQQELDQLASCCAAQTLSGSLELCCGVSRFIPRPTKQPIRVKIVITSDNYPSAVNAAIKVAEGENIKLLIKGLLLKSDTLDRTIKETDKWSICNTIVDNVMIEAKVPSNVYCSYFPRSCSILFKNRLFFDESLPTLWLSDWCKRMTELYKAPNLSTTTVLGFPIQVEDEFREHARLWRRKTENRMTEENKGK